MAGVARLWSEETRNAKKLGRRGGRCLIGYTTKYRNLVCRKKYNFTQQDPKERLRLTGDEGFPRQAEDQDEREGRASNEGFLLSEVILAPMNGTREVMTCRDGRKGVGVGSHTLLCYKFFRCFLSPGRLGIQRRSDINRGAQNRRIPFS